MRTVRVNQAQSGLPELVNSLATEGEIVITENDKPVARLTAPENEQAANTSLPQLRPSSVGSVLKPLSSNDDLLAEMSGNDRP